MPKMKTHRTSAKRFARTGAGKFKKHRAGKRHKLTGKTTKRKRHLRKADLVSPADHAKVERLLPYL